MTTDYSTMRELPLQHDSTSELDTITMANLIMHPLPMRPDIPPTSHVPPLLPNEPNKPALSLKPHIAPIPPSRKLPPPMSAQFTRLKEENYRLCRKIAALRKERDSADRKLDGSERLREEATVNLASTEQELTRTHELLRKAGEALTAKNKEESARDEELKLNNVTAGVKRKTNGYV